MVSWGAGTVLAAKGNLDFHCPNFNLNEGPPARDNMIRLSFGVQSPAAIRRGVSQVTAMGRGNALADGQAEPNAFWLGGKKGVKQLVLQIPWDAVAVVGHANLHLAAPLQDLDCDAPILATAFDDGVHAVLDEIDQYLLNLNIVQVQVIE